jgi:uncharacterized protein (UPF0548 family)
MRRRHAAKLAALARKSVNYDPDGAHDETLGWRHDDYRQRLGVEAAGEPEPGGYFEAARELLAEYKAVDPKIVHAWYDTDAPLEGRNMLLQLRFHGLFGVYAGCRVGTITDEQRVQRGRTAQVWGWPYMTLEGHFEQGEMSWEVWKWLDNGVVEFRVHAFSRGTPEGNPIVRLGFRVVGQFERRRYLRRACERMRDLTREAVALGVEVVEQERPA